jgi:hypothetical protein
MTTLARITGLAATALLLLTATLQVPASAHDWSPVSDDLCDYCGSYADAHVPAGVGTSAYLPDVGYLPGESQSLAAHVATSDSGLRRAAECAGKYACDETDSSLTAESRANDTPSAGVMPDRDATLVRLAK